MKTRTKRFDAIKSFEFNTATRGGSVDIYPDRSITYSWGKETPEQREHFMDWTIAEHQREMAKDNSL